LQSKLGLLLDGQSPLRRFPGERLLPIQVVVRLVPSFGRHDLSAMGRLFCEYPWKEVKGARSGSFF